MDPHDDPMAKYRAKAAEMRAALDREMAEDEAKGAAMSAVSEHRGGTLRLVAAMAGIAVLSLAIVGFGITLVGMSHHDFDDAHGTGWAVVEACDRHGPVTNQGFGYWDSCRFTVRWDDGTADDDLVSDGLFASADIGRDVRVGYLDRSADSMELAREDTPPRPWFKWIGVVVGIIGGLPLLVIGIMISLLLQRK
ncbi:hypothetical protein GCM10010112_88890 [Actinoplanes lobatus]|uniref:Uncharacterized protein n=1 Tax=Actinoplanes lobatus TaxID=113568 RepID=A0A7W7HQN4_9ACTN|nr:DUF6346 domain-containing protein [Actinoplanes lobatus]MBB4754931.1 hypothetical protein [Actinoplanes lobatus]GGN97064.1 hypothetical protein GCM10010112_88890 [Actinoplanes lobatus]GIE44539.1 hypothetical protein Alo02nite_74370 [Actinoplanes lobatus]